MTARIEKVLAEAWRVGEYVFNASASIGAAIYPADGEDAVELLRRADLKLYESKHEYKGSEMSS
ncbi:hypothetical protein SD70_20130 [Gordoniibacillus kamchatkensis]|uniref:GGDEF domain-containing protein n=1 Tax=Gordoniibacillus kamchatkensis TaxID=1590651 RepID=A0ABR5AEN3_9BACL|nr:hypothetical protein SD70_20130 [Paenibacillus sp. VKM B-2647]